MIQFFRSLDIRLFDNTNAQIAETVWNCTIQEHFDSKSIIKHYTRWKNMDE